MDKRGVAGSRIVVLFIWMILLTYGMAAKTLLVLQSDKDRAILEQSAKIAKGMGVAPVIKKEKGEYRLTVGPLPETEETAALFYRLRKEFPQAVALTLSGGSRVSSGTVSSSLKEGENSQESYRLWIALFALAIVGVLALFVSSMKMQRLEEHHEQIRRKHEEIEKRFNELFHHMGENLYRLSKDLVHSTRSLSKEVQDQRMGEKLKKVVQKEKKVMQTTGNLLEFLRIKAHKVVISKESFSIDSMLEEVTESLAKTPGLIQSGKEVIYFVDSRLPKYIIGDYVHIGEALGNLLQEALLYAAASEVKLSLRAYRTFNSEMELHGEITYKPLREDPLEGYFTPEYDELQNRYERINRFVARELIELMGGTAEAAEASGGQILVRITLPVEAPQNEERRKYRLRSVEDTQKKVLVIQESYEASLAIKEMFSYFRHQVDVMRAERFERYRPNLEEYDILVIDESLITSMLVEYLETIRKNHPLKVVGLRGVFDFEHPIPKQILDQRELRPLTMIRVFGLINDLFAPVEEEEFEVPTPKAEEPLRTLEEIPVTPDIGLKSFVDFAGARLLIAEDNPINLKMMLRVLEHSGMEIITAQNGKEALEQVKSAEEGWFDLVLMDINMPVMDGIVATVEIRKTPQGKSLPVVALTALGLESIKERLIQAGFDGYLPKPINLGQLYTLFGRYLPHKGGSHTSAEGKEKPVEIEGIDIKEALERVQGNELVLKEVLGAFLEGYGQSDRQLRELIENREYESLRQLTLDLVGLSGSLGAKQLYEAVRQMHRHVLQKRWELIQNDLIAYEDALARVRRGITRYLEA